MNKRFEVILQALCGVALMIIGVGLMAVALSHIVLLLVGLK